jgi:hypothetical protein
MPTRRINMVDRDKTKKFVIKKGKRDLLKKRIQSRMVALMSAAYAHWEDLARNHWSDGTGWRYLEGLYFSPISNNSDIQIKMKQGTLGGMLEGGYPTFNMYPAMQEAAFRRGGTVHVPMGDKGTYEGSVVDRNPIPTQESLLRTVRRNDDSPNRAIDALLSSISNRGIQNTAVGTKSLGKYSGGNPSFVTVSITKPAEIWQMKEYRGAKIADSVAYFVEQNKESFLSDLFPTSTTIDF